MKVHRVVLLVVDHDNLGAASVVESIANVRYPNHCLTPRVMEIETREVDWTDQHPLNHASTKRAAFEKLFTTKLFAKKD